MKNLSIVIPVYNNSDTLLKLTKDIFKVLSKINLKNFEVVFVDDFSKDNSLKILLSIKKKFKKIKILKNFKNKGQLASMLGGLKNSIAKNYIVMSADLQDDPSHIKSHILRLKTNKIVLACRKNLVGNLFTKFTSLIHYKIMRTEIKNFPKYGLDFFSFRKEIRDILINNIENIEYLTLSVVNLSNNYKTASFSYEKKERPYGKSQYTFLKRIGIHFKIASSIGFFKKIFWYFSFLLASLFILWGAYIFYNFITNPSPVYTGWRSIILLLILFNSIILIKLNIIDETLNKMIKKKDFNKK